MSLKDDLMSVVGKESNIDKEYNKKIIKAPFGWVGGKTYLCDGIIDILPHRRCYIEPFGGSGITLLKKQPSEIEVFNDRNSGITDFYLCLQEQPDELLAGINELVMSKELFYHYLNNTSTIDNRLRRAIVWYYIIRCSWGGKMKYFAAKKGGDITRQLYVNLEFFPEIHKRLRNVVIENHDYSHLLEYYDAPDAVFYCDPPYINCNGSHYYEYDIDHNAFLDKVFDMDSYVLVSNFESTEYLSRDWDEVIQVKQRYSMHREGRVETDRVECLYIKEAR